MIVFLFSNSKIMSHSPFACNWKKKGFWDSEPIFTHFPSNKSGTSDIRIPCNSTELHPYPMYTCCLPYVWVGPELYVETKCFVSYSFDSISEAHE